MAIKRITSLPAAAALAGTELFEVSQRSATVVKTAATLSAQASDNSFNDSGGGFVTAGFTVGMRVNVSGFTGNVANNITVGTITALTANKMTIGGTDGDVIVDDAAGETVTITQWVSVRAAVDGLAARFLLASYLDTDGTLAANSDVKIATQKAVKTYVDGVVTGLLDYKGATDCSGNPNYPAALKGDAYVVSVAGKIGGASGVSVDVGDVYFASADNAGGTQAAVGASWVSLEHNAVAASAYTDAMARAAVNIAPTTQAGTSYTAVIGDAGGYIQFTSAASVAFTIPPNSSVAFPIGTVITGEQNGSGVVTITAGAGVTLRSRGGLLATGGQYAVAQVKKVATDTWTVIGDVA